MIAAFAVIEEATELLEELRGKSEIGVNLVSGKMTNVVVAKVFATHAGLVL